MAPSPTAQAAPTPRSAARRRRRMIMEDDDDAAAPAPAPASAATTGAGDATPSPPPRLETLGRLATPVARKADSIASQFQREILGSDLASKTPQLRRDAPAGNEADDNASTQDDIQISTPETFTTKGATAAASARDATSSTTEHTGADVAHAIAIASDTEEEEEEKKDSGSGAQEEQKRSERAPNASPSPRRTTLSPAKASLLVTSDSSIVLDDSAISRRDTVSPQALKSLLQSISLNDASPRAQTEQSHPAAAGDGQRESDSTQERTSSSVNQFLASSSASTSLLQTPDSVRKTRAMQRKETEERTLSPSEALSMTLNDVALPRAPTSRRLSTLHEDAVVDETDDGDAPSTTSRLTASHESSRRATLEPTDAADFLAALRDEMASASDSETQQSKDMTTSSRKRRQTIQTTAPAVTDASPVTRSRSRRTTVDPSDIVSLSRDTVSRSAAGRRETLNVDDLDELGPSGTGRGQEPGRTPQSRRETLNVDDLHELHAELQQAVQDNDDREDGSEAMHVDASSSASRKRKQQDEATAESNSSTAASPVSTSATKKSRSSANASASPPRDSVVSMQSRQAAGLARPQKTPTPGKQSRSARENEQQQQNQSETPGRRNRGLERQSLLAKFSSPPPAAAPTKTPLRGILSAKKPAAAVGLLSTPTKSVNFGPPQGAEFNLGSPSTSMTPMLAKDARRLFPLDRAASPPLGQADEDEDEDEETSLNTSLLDEADAIDSDDAEQKDDDGDEDDTMERTLGRLSAALSAKSPPDKNRRRFSLRGVSPLDNQANARRWRRTSVSAVVRSPVSARKLKGIEPGALAPPAPRPAPTPAHTSVFLSDPTESAVQGRTAYADSSASSDASEDMEITGDFSAFVQASGLLSASAKKAAAAMPDFRFRGRTKDAAPSVFDDSLQGDGDTVELGSLGDLLAESAAYATAKATASAASSRSDAAQPPASTSAPASATENGNDDDDDGDDSDTPALGSLGDLARESEERASPRTNSVVSAAAMRRFNSRHYSQLDEQDVTLDPILEEDEDGGTSSAPSRMSLDTSDDGGDSDTGEYSERRKSLVVNLSSQFDSVGSPSPPRSPRADASESNTVTAAELSARIRSPLRPSPRRTRDASSSTGPRISMNELLKRAGVDAIAPAAAPDDHFRDLYAPSTVAADATVDAVKRAAVSVACKDVVKWHIDEISSWSAGLTDVLASLLSESAPPLFSSDEVDAAAIDDAIKALYELETARVQSGLGQWRTKMETEVVEKLDATAAELDKDVRALKQRVSNDTATQQSELGALQELIARETQMAELLDAIDEQQVVQNEYAATVDTLETQCAALSLEASVLEDKLRVAENMASERNLVSPEAAAELERQVLHVEEVSAIQASLSIWRVVVATSSHLKLSAQLDDVVVRIDLQIDVVLSDLDAASDTGGGGFSTDVTSNVTLKQRRSMYFEPSDKDIVRLVQQKLFDAVQLSRFIRTANSSQHDETKHLDRPRRICTLLQDLERYVTLSYRFLRELRALSAQYAVEYVVESSVLWVEFLNFAPTRESKFVVGFALLDEFPFAHFETSVDVVYGPVPPDTIRAEIEAEAAKQNDYEFISRICERLRNAFVLR